MLPSLNLLRKRLLEVVATKTQQGHITAGLADQVRALPASYDALHAFAQKLAVLPLRQDWPYLEPNDLPAIQQQSDPARSLTPIAALDPAVIAPRVQTAFLSSVCGCILGKPLEVNPTLDALRAAAESVGEWPLRDYISEKMLLALNQRHGSWTETSRENIRYAASDDDLNYTVAGMLLLEQHGRGFTKDDLAALWGLNFPSGWQWGPERTMNINVALQSLGNGPTDPYEQWVNTWNPGDEFCGALIRADAYGYACPGHPALAAELALRDASFSHRRTGIYGTMFIAAAIATAFTQPADPLAIFRTALQYVPQKSRFAEMTRFALDTVAAAPDWLAAYRLIHDKLPQYSHCWIYQEVGTLINTLRFATDIGDGICKQVSQGNDTDSFGCTAGSLLGAYLGPEKLDPRWLRPFNDTIYTSLATFHEQKLSAVAQRMGDLPRRIL